MYPNGHLGALDEHQQQALEEFKAFLTEKGDYKPGPPPSHDDQTLLRFLRARRWIVPDAYKQFNDTETWRQANQLDVLYDTIDVDSYEECRQMYPQWTGRRDRRGIPLYLFKIRHLDSKTVAAYEKTSYWSRAEGDHSTPDKLLRLCALYENLTRFAQPLCTQLPDREHNDIPVTLSTNIVDVSGVSLRMFWNLKGHMQAASQLATAHYPETLDRIFIIGAPAFFSTVWQWIKRWFDPITVSKIFILSEAEVLPTLTSFIDIKNIPKSYGGELEFDWGERPNLDTGIHDVCKWENGHKEFPPGPCLWRTIEDGEKLECIAVGSVDKVERRERVCTVDRRWKGVIPALPQDVADVDQLPTTVDGAAEGEKSAEKAPAVANGAAVESTESSAATAAEPTQAPKADGPTVTDVQGVQNLSIQDNSVTEMSEKVATPADQAQPSKVVA